MLCDMFNSSLLSERLSVYEIYLSDTEVFNDLAEFFIFSYHINSNKVRLHFLAWFR